MYIQIGAQNIEKYADLRAFNIFANIIAAAYQANLDVLIHRIKKITIDLTDKEIEEEVGLFESTCLIFKRFDFESYFAKNNTNRKLEILDTIQNGIMQMCEKYNSDTKPFVVAYQKVVEQNFEHKEFFNRFTFAKNRQHKAAIEFEIKEEGAQVNVLFINKIGERLAKREVIRLKPNYYFIHKLIHKGRWIDNDKYVVSDKNEVVNLIASMSNPEIKLVINSTTQTNTQILEKLSELKV